MGDPLTHILLRCSPLLFPISSLPAVLLNAHSDVVVQIVDARAPLAFRCEDVATYVTEVDPDKKNLLLINKADMLTKNQRAHWAKYERVVAAPALVRVGLLEIMDVCVSQIPK